MNADALYTEVWPDYFATQRRDLWFYERLWLVLLRQLEGRTGNRWLLEFGSGPGFLLALAWRRGWWAQGVEPSAVARLHAAQLEVLSFRDPPSCGHFGAAIATEVLEHVDDTAATLREWRSALIPGGFLALSVPNDNNPLQRLFGSWIAPPPGDSGGLVQCVDRRRPWIHPTHKSYFNPKSLKALLEQAGFEVVWQRTSFPVELLLAVPFLSRKAAWKLSRLWPAPPFLWRFGIGRHCLAVARKT